MKNSAIFTSVSVAASGSTANGGIRNAADVGPGWLGGLSASDGVDGVTSVSGLAGGFVTAWLAGEPRLVDDWKEKIWTVAAGLSLLATVVAFAMMMLRFLEISGK